MTFGEIKTAIEEILIESYKDQKGFKKVMNEFHQNILTNKSLSKIYSLYDDLSSEKGLSEADAKEYLREGIDLIRNLIETTKLPRFTPKKVQNKYSDLDTLVYRKNVNISERINAKKNIIGILTKNTAELKESINLPINSMVSIANQTLKNFVENLNEEDRKKFLRVTKGDQKELESEFTKLKESAVQKLETILISENEFEIKTKISETIDRVKKEEYNQMNYVRLSSLEKSI